MYRIGASTPFGQYMLQAASLHSGLANKGWQQGHPLPVFCHRPHHAYAVHQGAGSQRHTYGRGASLQIPLMATHRGELHTLMLAEINRRFNLPGRLQIVRAGKQGPLYGAQ